MITATLYTYGIGDGSVKEASQRLLDPRSGTAVKPGTGYRKSASNLKP